jgi:iron complex transport system ATP-binding protein
MNLKAEHLHVTLKGNKILQDVSVNLNEPGITAVLGPNGAGKTTLLRCLTSMLKPLSCTVSLGGEPIGSYGPKAAAKHLSHVPQRSVSPGVTVFDAVLIGRIPHMRYRASSKDFAAVSSVLEQLQLREFCLRPLHTLSGGELQKVSIARALVQQTPIMLLDEPTASLDLRNQLQILKLLRTIADSRQIKILITIHDINTALRYADRFIFMKQGRITAWTQKEQVTSEMVEAVYDVPVILQWYQEHPMVMPRHM